MDDKAAPWKSAEIFPERLPAAQEWSVPLSGKRSRHKNKQSHLTVLLRELMCKNKHVRAGKGTEQFPKRRIQRYFLGMQRDADRNSKASLELKAAGDVKNNNKGFHKLMASRSTQMKDKVICLYFSKVVVGVYHNCFCGRDSKVWTKQMNHKTGQKLA